MLLTAMAFQFKRLVRVLVVCLLTVLLLSTYLFDRQAPPTGDVTASRGRSIEAVERHCLLFDVGGRLFNEDGRGAPVHGSVRYVIGSHAASFK